jgi:hypothetical protein
MKKQINECSCGCGGERENGHYMFMGNLKTMRKHIDSMLQMDPQQVEQLLNNGHDWAADHIATSKDDIEEVAGFLSNEIHHGHEMDSYNSQQPQFVPVGFKNHLKQLMPERIEKTESGYFATTETGRRLSKQPKSKKDALAQLAAVEISKHKK